MASSGSKYPFFENLRTVAATVSSDIQEIEKKMQKSKFELPENNAMFKLIDVCDDVNTYKSDSQALLKQLRGENQKYVSYHQDIELLVDEMEKGIDSVEELLVGYGYQKWHPECMFSSNTTVETPKQMLPTLDLPVEGEQHSALQKTPVLADYGLTAKVPKYLPSVLKDKQSVVKSTKKQVHFESPERVPDLKGKENKVPYSLQKTPLLKDYGLPSRERNQCVPETKDSVCIKKRLDFHSPLCSVSNNITYSPDSLPCVSIDNTDDFRDLAKSFNSDLDNVFVVPKVQNDVELSTPEEPPLLSSQRSRLASKRQNETVTPEEPEIQPIRILGASKVMDVDPSTPKTPEFEATSSLENWLRSQKKK